MKWWAALVAATSLFLASCGSIDTLPDREFDWCYEFNFVDQEYFSRTYGY